MHCFPMSLSLAAAGLWALSHGLPAVAQDVPPAVVAEEKAAPAPAATAKYPTPPHVELTGHTADLGGNIQSRRQAGCDDLVG
jgi:hypothetical protein